LIPTSRTTLRDGSSVLIRPIAPEDRELLRSGFERLSERSRYLRFQSPLTQLSDEQLSYLTVVDHHDHEALLAVTPEGDDAVGVARFVRVNHGVAECAIVVADDWQNRGLGTELLERLVERAREEDIDRFYALVLAENADALRLVERLGDTVRRAEGSQVELEIELPPPRGSTANLRLVLAAAARGLVLPVISMWRQVADFAHLRRRAEAVTEPANAIVAYAYDEGSVQEAPALTVAAGLAAARNAHVHLVASYWPVLSNREEADSRLSAAADELRGRGIGVSVHLVGGDTVDAVIDVAVETEAALIVIDPRAGGAMTPWRASSLPARVCARAPCDVLLARDPASGT
jgi:RimJ/RimL family protein N-acetyltransferase